jgi:hypothetical protein
VPRGTATVTTGSVPPVVMTDTELPLPVTTLLETLPPAAPGLAFRVSTPLSTVARTASTCSEVPTSRTVMPGLVPTSTATSAGRSANTIDPA